MDSDNLPLFNWEPPRKLILFPLAKRVGKIRHTAQLLSTKQGEDAVLYHKQVMASNRKHLARFGLSDYEIEHELRGFFNAVQHELIRMSRRGDRQ